MPDIGSSHNAAFSDGLNFTQNMGKANAGSITLGGSLQSGDGMNAHGVLATTVGTGSPADTNSGVEFGQQALGNRDDAEQAGQSIDRMLMQRAADIGTDDNTA
jgi:hypothetical protein